MHGPTAKGTPVERGEGLRCPMNVAVHKGILYAFRSYLYSRDLAVAVAVESATSRLPPGETSIFVTRQVQRDLGGTPWEERLQPVECIRILNAFLVESQ